jgi:hypothetical protein
MPYRDAFDVEASSAEHVGDAVEDAGFVFDEG